MSLFNNAELAALSAARGVVSANTDANQLLSQLLAIIDKLAIRDASVTAAAQQVLKTPTDTIARATLYGLVVTCDNSTCKEAQ